MNIFNQKPFFFKYVSPSSVLRGPFPELPSPPDEGWEPAAHQLPAELLNFLKPPTLRRKANDPIRPSQQDLAARDG